MTRSDIEQFADTNPNVEEWVDFIERYVEEARSDERLRMKLMVDTVFSMVTKPVVFKSFTDSPEATRKLYEESHDTD